MKKIQLFILFVALCSSHLFGQILTEEETLASQTTTFDKIERTKRDTAIANQFLKRANVYYKMEQLDSIAILGEQASSIYAENEYWEGWVDGQLFQVMYHYLQGDTLAIAKDILTHTLAVSQAELGEDAVATGKCLMYEGVIALAEFKIDEALELFTNANTILSEEEGQEEYLAQLYSYTAYAYHHFKQDFDKARNYLETALIIRKTVFGVNDPTVAQSCLDLGLLFQDLEKEEIALIYFEQALGKYYHNYSQNIPSVAAIHYNIGNLQLALGKTDQAITSYKKGIELLLMTTGIENYLGFVIHTQLGQTYAHHKEDKAAALPYLKKALDLDATLKVTQMQDLTYRHRIMGKIYTGL